MEQVGTKHVVRNWSEVLCCTFMTHHEIKVTDRNFMLKFLVKDFRKHADGSS